MQGAGRISALTFFFFFFFFSFSFSALFSSPSKCCCGGSINTNNDPQELPLFREAPVFHNGRECVTPTTIVEIEPEENPLTAVCNRGSYYRTSSVHVAMTLEGGYMRGTLAAVLSIVQHAACPENIIFHFLACSLLEDHVSSRVRSTFPYLRFHIYPFDADRVRDRISASVREALEHPLNYARIYLAETLPDCIHRVIYLDSDLLLFDDIAKLWATELHGYPLAAPEYCQVNLASYFTATFWSDPALSSVFRNRRRRPCYFNTGVMVMDLRKWREEGYARVIEMWMVLQKERRIYELGSLPPFLLLFAGRVEPVGHCWNQHGLGGDNYKGRCRALHPGPVSLLHWSGKGKPWDRLDAHQPCPLDSLWAPYDLLDVSSSSRPY